MNYINKNLTANETIEAIFNFHWIVKVSPIIFLVVGSLLAMVDGLLMVGLVLIAFGAFMLLSIYKTEQAVTSSKVILKTGIIARKTEELCNNKIETIELKQGIFGRIFGYGDVQVTGAGISSVTFKNLSVPTIAKLAIEKVVFN